MFHLEVFLEERVLRLSSWIYEANSCKQESYSAHECQNTVWTKGEVLSFDTIITYFYSSTLGEIEEILKKPTLHTRELHTENNAYYDNILLANSYNL